MNLLMKGAALAPPFSCTTKYSSDVYSPRPPDIRVRLLPTKPPVHFTTEQPGRDRKVFFGEKRREIGSILRTLCNWKGIKIIEAEVCADHIHMLIEIPPKIAVASFMG